MLRFSQNILHTVKHFFCCRLISYSYIPDHIFHTSRFPSTAVTELNLINYRLSWEQSNHFQVQAENLLVLFPLLFPSPLKHYKRHLELEATFRCRLQPRRIQVASCFGTRLPSILYATYSLVLFRHFCERIISIELIFKIFEIKTEVFFKSSNNTF